jgi:hypothetical protein
MQGMHVIQSEAVTSHKANDKVYQLLAHGRWFSSASSTTKTGRHDLAEILLKVALNPNSLRNPGPHHSLNNILYPQTLMKKDRSLHFSVNSNI